MKRDVTPITEFDIEFDEGAPRHNVGEIVEARAIELLKQHRVDPKAHILLMPMHSRKDCPADGGPIASYRFDVCICPVIRIIIVVVSGTALGMMREVSGLVTHLGDPIEKGEGD